MTDLRKHLALSLKKKIKAARDDEPTISYRIYQYRQELRLKNKKDSILCQRKLLMTQALVSNSAHNISEYSVEELMNMNRSVVYERILKSSQSL